MTDTDRAVILAARDLAAQHVSDMVADLRNAATRNEHMRLTQLAQQATDVVTALDLVLEDD